MRKRINLILLVLAICTFTSYAVVSSNCAAGDQNSDGVCDACDAGYRKDATNDFCYTCYTANCADCTTERATC